MLVMILLWAEMAAFTALGVWMAWSVYMSAKGDRRFMDSSRFSTACFSFLLVYRDWRIVYVDHYGQAKIVMCIVGLVLCAFSMFAAKAYGRGAPLR